MSRSRSIAVATAAGLLLCAAGAAFLTGCTNGHASAPHAVTDGDGEEQERPAFAADRAVPDEKAVPFDGKRAIRYLEAICAIGPRMSGTAGMRKQQELIRKHFTDLGMKVQEQDFAAKQTSRQNPVEMTNLVVSYHPERKRRVILCSHYDTRPIADQEPNPRKWHDPFVSANDGGSGVAFLMELANHMKALKTEVGVDFVFFDGEEYIFEPRRDQYFFGSKHFAASWRKMKPRPDYIAGILLDMIGGRNARFKVEGHSWQRASALVKQIWGVAKELKSPMFVADEGASVLDDHISLQGVGIRAIDIIDFDYPHWHRLTDVPENCSGESLAEVSRVLTTWLQRVK